MSTNLYVIGNGFDLWHGLPTSYKCFNCFMHRMHPQKHDIIGHLFNQNDPNALWSDFENQLGAPDLNSMIGYICTISVRKGVGNSLDNAYFSMKEFFKEWVEQIHVSVFNNRFLQIDKSASFLTFNYTNTLEKLYGVDSGRICYIHGNTKQNELCQPVVGHRGPDNYAEINKTSIYEHLSRINTNISTYEIIKEIDEFYDSLSKEPRIIRNDIDVDKFGNPCCYYIEQNSAFFDRQYFDVYVLGHSLSKIDVPYFQRIYNESPKATWHVSCYGENEMHNKKQKLCDLLGVPQNSIAVELFSLDALELKN